MITAPRRVMRCSFLNLKSVGAFVVLGEVSKLSVSLQFLIYAEPLCVPVLTVVYSLGFL